MGFRPLRQWLQHNPAVLGLTIGGALLLGLLLQEIILDRFPVIFGEGYLLQDFRIAVVHCLLAGYLPSAYLFLLRATRNTVHQLTSAADASYIDSAVHMGRRTLIIAGSIGVLCTVASPYLTTPSPWDPSTWHSEVWWHRVLGLFVGWWVGWFVAAIWSTSARISRLAARVGAVDLLDLSAWSPFVKQGLLTALLTVGSVSILGLLLLEPRQWLVVALAVGLCLPLALLGLLLPVRGVHRRILQAKQAELEWARGRIRQSRALLQGAPSHVAGDTSEAASPGQMADLIAYLQLVEDVPEWPFQASAILQVTLYLLIPIVSWFGGLLIESSLDRLFG